MSHRPCSFIDFAAIPGLAAKLLSLDAAMLLDGDINTVLWANAAAANLLGAGTARQLQHAGLGGDAALSRQLLGANAQFNGSETISRGLRFMRDGKSMLLQCKLSRIARTGETNQLLLICDDAKARMPQPEHLMAQAAIDSLAGAADYAAIVDQYGLPIAYTDLYAKADPDPDALEALCHAAAIDGGPVARLVQSSDGVTRSLAAFRVQEEPLRLLLTGDASPLSGGQAGSDDELPVETVSGDLQLQDDIGRDASRGDTRDEMIAVTGEPEFHKPADESLTANVDAAVTDRRAETPASAGQPAQDDIAAADHRASPVPVRTRLESWYLGRTSKPAEASDNGPAIPAAGKSNRSDSFVKADPPGAIAEEGFAKPIEDDLAMASVEGHSREIADSAPTGAGDGLPQRGQQPLQDDKPAEVAMPAAPELQDPSSFAFAGSSDPVRFAWTVDADQVFSAVSPELAKTVGPNAADIVTRKWSDVAKVFGFDRHGEIQRLLEKRDTWSGKSVLWPVQGTDLVVPVDLAALPAFSGARQFDGFRGFGIIRTLDAVIDPDETGMALVPGPTRKKNRDLIQDSAAGDFNRDVERRQQSLESDGEPQFGSVGTNAVHEPPARDSNVVTLGARKRDRLDELSSREAKAFNEIGKKLVEEPSAPAGEAVASPHEIESNVAKEFADNHAVEASILKNLPVPVLVYRAGETLYANPELLSVCGFENVEALAQAGGVDALFATAGIAEGENGTISLRRFDGGPIGVKPLLQSVSWEGKKALLLSFRSPAHAIVEEKAAIDIARVSELQNILDTATDGILVTSRDGIIESLNGPAEALFGVSFKSVAGRHLADLFARESHKPVEEYMRELKEPGVAGLINNGREVIGLHSNSGLVPLFLTLGRMGKEEKFCAVLRDMTQWKKAEEDLVSARRAAETASEQKSEFLARVSHEIRTPLNAIIGFSDVMIEERFGPIENERYRGYLRDINRSGVHVLDLINDLLDISKIEAGKMEMTYEAVDLNQLVSETVALLQPQANGERIIIRTSLSRAVPRVVADARSVRQIILNLVSNAIKFTAANGQVIVSTVYEANGEVVMRVRDTGRGMSEREIEMAMKPFHQVKFSDSKRGQGTGLGLPLTKALVEANRAYFDLESEPGEGTIAHVHFPTQRVLAD